jgi:hypothetical protein
MSAWFEFAFCVFALVVAVAVFIRQEILIRRDKKRRKKAGPVR